MQDGRRRPVIEDVRPRVDDGRFPAKRAVGEWVDVAADILVDGHDRLRALCLYRKASDVRETALEMTPTHNDLWTAAFQVAAMEEYFFTIRAWVDEYATWLDGLTKKHAVGQNVAVELLDGALLVEEAAARATLAAPVGDDAATLTRYASQLREAGEEGRRDASRLSEGVFVAKAQRLNALMAVYPDAERITELGRDYAVSPEPALAASSAWYELFPRSTGPSGVHGTLADLERELPRIAEAGFDVVYLPPIHPIGKTFRKGKNNSPTAESGDVGSPWAIGAAEGGHKAVHPDLGTIEEFEQLTHTARDRHGLEIAIDIAFQCSPDHPYVAAHPQWFKKRADGAIQYAENPPKKYQDVYPFNFECGDWRNLWEELASVFLFWRERGVRVFRVDNPHTKPLAFWEWCLGEVRRQFPDTIFLSEAFTRPKIMYRLAKAGFTQSYTYFTWRNSKQELTAYMTELVERAPRDYFRPNFWPNTPDILPEYLQYGGRPAFVIRYVLAATLSSNFGIYGPAFELCENDAVAQDSIEYLDSEKYELRDWDLLKPESLWPFITLVNRIRRETPALQQTWRLRFLPTDNDNVLFFAKEADRRDVAGRLVPPGAPLPGADGVMEHGEVALVAVNLDPHNVQTAHLTLPLEEFGVDAEQTYMVHDLLGDDKFIWQGPVNRMSFDPEVLPARIFRLKRRLKRETDFDYFM